MDEIRKLLELQSTDNRIADLGIRLTHLRTHRTAIEKRIDQERAAVQAKHDELAQMRHDSRMRNLEVDELDANIRTYQDRLDTGIISFKEMEDLRVKIEIERRRMGEMEDAALKLMDSIESTQGAVASADSDLAVREAELREQIAATDRDIARIEQEIAEAKSAREAAVAAVQPYLLAQYEMLHAKFENPVAEIHNGTCSGCQLRLSGNTIARTRGDMGVITCEHCSRILYCA